MLPEYHGMPLMVRRALHRKLQPTPAGLRPVATDFEIRALPNSGERAAYLLEAEAFIRSLKPDLLDLPLTPENYKQRFSFLLYALEWQMMRECEELSMQQTDIVTDDDLRPFHLFALLIPGLEGGELNVQIDDKVSFRYVNLLIFLAASSRRQL